MSLEFYKLLHVLGIVLIFSGLVTILTLKMAGAPIVGKVKSFGFLTHGIGMLFVLISGFGLAAKIGIMAQLPIWVYAKLFIWLWLGLGIALAKRRGHLGWPVMILFLGLAASAGYLGLFKPF